MRDTGLFPTGSSRRTHGHLLRAGVREKLSASDGLQSVADVLSKLRADRNRTDPNIDSLATVAG